MTQTTIAKTYDPRTFNGTQRCPNGCGNYGTVEHVAACTGTTIRAQEAQDIAQAEGFAILEHSSEWTGFTLDDGQEVPDMRGQWPNVRAVGTKTIRTHFTWSGSRFEGFVS